MTARYAIYFAPPADTPLADFGNRWLGRDPVTGASLSPGTLTAISATAWREAVAAPSRYGFHATLKAPFRLADGATEERLIAAVTTFARGRAPVAVGRLKIARFDGFLALVPAAAAEDIGELANDCVGHFDGFRAPADARELRRRCAPGLTPRQRKMLQRWGYPYVLDDFRFHMTLTGRLPERQCGCFREEIERRLGDALALPLEVDSICVFAQAVAGQPFRLHHRAPLARPGA